MKQVSNFITNIDLQEDTIYTPPHKIHPPPPRISNRQQIDDNDDNNHDSHNAKMNLLLINSIGRKENLKLALYNKVTHFPSDSWACIAFVHADESTLPDTNHHLQKLENPNIGNCQILRLPGTQWGHFLQFVPPALVSPSYNHVAILLDDIFLPEDGPSPIHVPTLLKHMKDYNLQSISPGVRGDHHGWMDPLGQREYQNCLMNVQAIEIYFQIFTAEGWECFYHLMHYSGGKGWCYDVCFKNVCGASLGIDYRMVAYHTEMKEVRASIPHKAIQSTGLHFHGESKEKKGYSPEEIAINSFVCQKYDCTKPTPEEFMLDTMQCDSTKD